MEGPDDQGFVDRIFVPRLLRLGFDHAQSIPWAEEPKGKRKAFVHTFTNSGALYTVLIDQDGLCITERKSRYTTRHPFVDPTRVMVACAEIEAWYAAGATGDAGQILAPIAQSADEINKESFARHSTSIAETPKLAKLHILEDFDFEQACQRSASFSYVARKILVQPAR